MDIRAHVIQLRGLRRKLQATVVLRNGHLWMPRLVPALYQSFVLDCHVLLMEDFVEGIDIEPESSVPSGPDGWLLQATSSQPQTRTMERK